MVENVSGASSVINFEANIFPKESKVMSGAGDHIPKLIPILNPLQWRPRRAGSTSLAQAGGAALAARDYSTSPKQLLLAWLRSFTVQMAKLLQTTTDCRQTKSKNTPSLATTSIFSNFNTSYNTTSHNTCQYPLPIL